MTRQSFARRLLGTTSLMVLSAAATIGAQQPAAAQSTISAGLYGGGTTLTSLALRQIFDCYAGTTIANDGNTFSSSFTSSPPSPNLLPTSCTMVSTAVEGMFAAVGSGNGQRAYIADDPDQLFRGSPTSAPAIVKKPSIHPPFRDSGNANFKHYPYPRLDFAVSDAPLAASIAGLTTTSFGSFVPSTDWQSVPAIIARTKTTASFKTTAVGAPIQLPVMEVPVAIALNTTASESGVTWNVQSALSPNTQAGGAIQLSAAQMCAIFSASVTNWNDTTTLIPYLDANGVQHLQHFYDDNTNGTLTPVAYTSGSLPIKMVYRADDSGTSYILTNYLANLCPLLDTTGTYNYKAIFTGVGITSGGTTPNLPSMNFSNLVQNIQAVRGADHHDTMDVDDDSDRPIPHWNSAEGSNHEALKIGTDAKHSGRIGYLSANFTQPYATTVSEDIDGTVVAAPAPLSASIQNELQRFFGVYHPGQTDSNGTVQNFVPPTPNNAEAAFSGLTAPSGSDYNTWNIYAQVYPAGSVFGGVTYDGLSVIGVPFETENDYVLTGAGNIDVYSCYSDAAGTRVPALKNWLAWVFGGSINSLPPYNPATSNSNSPGFDPNVASLIENNGFHELDSAWASNLVSAYLRTSTAGGQPSAIAAYNASGTQVDGCKGVTGGAK